MAHVGVATIQQHQAAQHGQHWNSGGITDTRLQTLVQSLHNAQNALAQVQAAVEIKELVLPSHPQQKMNQERIRFTAGAFEGLGKMVKSGTPHGMYQACFALAQLAWSNEANSRQITKIPGLLESLAAIFNKAHDTSMMQAQEQAAVAIGNCCANSKEASEIFANHTKLMESFREVLSRCNEARVRETAILALKNCAASSQDAAFVICKNTSLLTTIKSFAMLKSSSEHGHSTLRDMAVGAINSFSRSPQAVPLLNSVSVVDDVLQPALYGFASQVPNEELVLLTMTSAVANLSAEGGHDKVMRDWTNTASGQKAVLNLVKCLGYALSNSRWDQVSFTPHSVTYPLYNIVRSCPSAIQILLGSDIINHLALLLRTYQNYAHDTETLELGVRILYLLAQDEATMCKMRKLRVLKTLHAVTHHPHVRDCAQQLIEKLAASPTALCLGTLSSCGADSFLYRLDSDTLGMIARCAFFEE